MKISYLIMGLLISLSANHANARIDTAIVDGHFTTIYAIDKHEARFHEFDLICQERYKDMLNKPFSLIFDKSVLSFVYLDTKISLKYIGKNHLVSFGLPKIFINNQIQKVQVLISDYDLWKISVELILDPLKDTCIHNNEMIYQCAITLE